MGDGRVELAWASILAQANRNNHEHLHLVARITRGTGAAGRPSLSSARGRVVMDEAMDAAAAAMHHAAELVSEEDIDVRSISPSPTGPVVFFHHIGYDHDLRTWLTAFADQLATAGWHGRIAPAPQARPPDWVEDLRNVAHLTAYLGLTLNQPLPRQQDYWRAPRAIGWAVDPTVTAVLCEDLVSWAGHDTHGTHGTHDDAQVDAPVNAQVYVEQYRSQVRLAALPPPDVLAWTVSTTAFAGLTVLTDTPRHIRRVYLRSQGQVTCQVDNSDQDWQTQVQDLRATLTTHPDHLDVAFLRRTPTWTISWMDLQMDHPALPHVAEGEVRTNRHLWARHVPDAHGIQILTRDHLDRATTLTNWHIHELTPHRYLVEAHDLTPWYANDLPDPDVLTQARADFGDMILTPHAIAADPR